MALEQALPRPASFSQLDWKERREERTGRGKESLVEGGRDGRRGMEERKVEREMEGGTQART